MNNGGITVDDAQVRKALANLDLKSMNRAYKKGLQDALKPLRTQTIRNLRSSGIKNVNRKYVGKGGRTYNSMVGGVKSTIHNTGGRMAEDMYGNVHIMGDFRLKWFEMGTSLRKTRKGGNRGSIRKYSFFEQAVTQTSGQVTDILDEQLKKAIIKAWEKR